MAASRAPRRAAARSTAPCWAGVRASGSPGRGTRARLTGDAQPRAVLIEQVDGGQGLVDGGRGGLAAQQVAAPGGDGGLGADHVGERVRVLGGVSGARRVYAVVCRR